MITSDKVVCEAASLSSLLVCYVCGNISPCVHLCLTCGLLSCKGCLSNDAKERTSCCDTPNILESHLLNDIIGSFTTLNQALSTAIPIQQESNEQISSGKTNTPIIARPRAHDQVLDSSSTIRQVGLEPSLSEKQLNTPLLSPTRILNHTFESSEAYSVGPSPNVRACLAQLPSSPLLHEDQSPLALAPLLHNGTSGGRSVPDGSAERSSGAPLTSAEDSYGALINQIAKKARQAEAALERVNGPTDTIQDSVHDSQSTTDSIPLTFHRPPHAKVEPLEQHESENTNDQSSEKQPLVQVNETVARPISQGPPVVSIEYSDLCDTSRQFLRACEDRGWIDIRKGFASTGPMRYRALVMDSATVIRAGITLRLVKRTLKYMMALCEGIRVLDSSWLRESCLPGAEHLANPTTYEVDGTVRDCADRIPYRARTCTRDSEGRSILLDAYEFTLVRSSEQVVYLGSNQPDPGAVSNSCNMLSEADVRWMIHMCGGDVRESVSESEIRLGTPFMAASGRSGKIHVALGLRRPRRDQYSENSQVLSLSWLFDAICNQRPLPLSECPSHFFL